MEFDLKSKNKLCQHGLEWAEQKIPWHPSTELNMHEGTHVRGHSELFRRDPSMLNPVL